MDQKLTFPDFAMALQVTLIDQSMSKTLNFVFGDGKNTQHISTHLNLFLFGLLAYSKTAHSLIHSYPHNKIHKLS